MGGLWRGMGWNGRVGGCGCSGSGGDVGFFVAVCTGLS